MYGILKSKHGKVTAKSGFKFLRFDQKVKIINDQFVYKDKKIECSNQVIIRYRCDDIVKENMQSIHIQDFIFLNSEYLDHIELQRVSNQMFFYNFCNKYKTSLARLDFFTFKSMDVVDIKSINKVDCENLKDHKVIKITRDEVLQISSTFDMSVVNELRLCDHLFLLVDNTDHKIANNDGNYNLEITKSPDVNSNALFLKFDRENISKLF